MKVLTVTTSARGHAIVDALKRSASNPDVVSVCPSANPGIQELATRMEVHDVMDFNFIVDLAKQESVDFAFIGPEDPICGGLADLLLEQGIPSVAPTKDHARIEGSKGFTRELLTKHNLDASPKYKVFTNGNRDEIENYLREDLEEDYVVKYDALLGGKGVKLSGEHLETVDDGIAYANECIDEAGQVVIEEKLIGVEFSLISFVSGNQVVDTPCIQDHKRAYEGDTGPNTGGMGTYSDANFSLPFLTDLDVQAAKEINRAVADILMKEHGTPYKGLLYGGFIATKNGVRLIEYNCRFGDPEVLNILALLESDFVDLCQAIIEGTLTKDLVCFSSKATVCKYITPEGYPENKDQKGSLVTLPDIPNDVRIYFGDVSKSDDQILLGGSRSIGIVGLGDSIAEAESRCSDVCGSIGGPVRFRKDIGTNELVQKRIDTMNQLRG